MGREALGDDHKGIIRLDNAQKIYQMGT